MVRTAAAVGALYRASIVHGGAEVMPGIRLNDNELDVLLAEPPQMLKLYVVLLTMMDFATAIVGRYPRLSERALFERLYVETEQGRKVSGSPTRKTIRYGLERLQKLGMLERIGPMVYRCVLAEPIKLRPKKEGPMRGQDEGPSETQAGQGIQPQEGPMRGQEQGPTSSFLYPANNPRNQNTTHVERTRDPHLVWSNGYRSQNQQSMERFKNGKSDRRSAAQIFADECKAFD